MLSALLPSLGWAASGGASLSGGAATGAGAAVNVQPGNIPVTASSGGVSLATRASAMLRTDLSFSGSVPRSLTTNTIVIERLGHETHWNWEPTVTAQVAGDGTYSAVWHTNHVGRFSIRVVVQGNASTAAAAPVVAVTVYRTSLATLYGPGFWGQRTACGTVLRHATIGIANRTLRCGEKVALYYRGRTLIVPVIDRGPYANGADWDLTMATGRALGITGTAQIGAVSLPAQPQAAAPPAPTAQPRGH
jgi:rare lipoprotein A (peptidoglycan hydrolase)